MTVRRAHPIQDSPLIAVTPDGAEIVFVERYHATRSHQASYTVARFDARTGKRTARPYPYTPLPITAATRDSVVSWMIDGADARISREFLDGFHSRAAAREAILRPLGSAEYHAPITDVVAGADRSVWLREHATGQWIVLGRDGAARGRLALPGGMQLLHADARAIWAATADSARTTGGRQLIRYRIVEP